MQKINTSEETEKPGLYQKPNMPNINQLEQSNWQKGLEHDSRFIMFIPIAVMSAFSCETTFSFSEMLGKN